MPQKQSVNGADACVTILIVWPVQLFLFVVSILIKIIIWLLKMLIKATRATWAFFNATPERRLAGLIGLGGIALLSGAVFCVASVVNAFSPTPTPTVNFVATQLSIMATTSAQQTQTEAALPTATPSPSPTDAPTPTPANTPTITVTPSRTLEPTLEDFPTAAPAEPTKAYPPGVTAVCNDGTYSHAQHHRGACSGHGGVAYWVAVVPP